jgi:hypothetical protein
MAGEYTAKFDHLIKQLEGLSQEVIRGSEAELAAALRRVVEEAIAAQRAPTSGAPWEPRVKGTAPMLQGAPLAMGFAMLGSTMWIRLTGVEARHHRGWVRGGTARELIFKDRLSPAAIDAISKVLERRFTEAMST